MSLPATARFRLAAAPGLGLTQDILNTRAIAVKQFEDLLSDTATAQRWLSPTLAEWSLSHGSVDPALVITDADLRGLVRLRTHVEALVSGAPARQVQADFEQVAATIQLAPDGAMSLAPTGSGWRWLASAVHCELMLAQQAGTWSRLKLCRNRVCRSAFYDNSRNNSGVWHNTKTCGNAANLRASRERRRAPVAE